MGEGPGAQGKLGDAGARAAAPGDAGEAGRLRCRRVTVRVCAGVLECRTLLPALPTPPDRSSEPPTHSPVNPPTRRP